jgi:hypothetical protein
MRIVREKVIPAGTGRLRSGESATDIKEYLDRVAKYVPAEVVAAYISANGVATQARAQGILFSLIFAACLICTPIYITRFTNTRREAWINSLMGVTAFIVWAYATGGGLIKYLDWYDAPTASVILVLFTLISGAVVPVVKQQPPKPTIIPNPSS